MASPSTQANIAPKPVLSKTSSPPQSQSQVFYQGKAAHLSPSLRSSIKVRLPTSVPVSGLQSR
ncbi:hypothetical protein DPMN_194304 [Dreissena polymorpha]|uniref:Uncharacterized protein n=1 Tax=Dreissena polymorpha TaxID=45954 RepID=A0A9D4BEU0_DREPO|nr:hypothetical protein DPMN_194304 [Dreissena polymorpha]